MIHIYLFGNLRLLLPGRHEPVERFRTRATGALLGLLAFEPGRAFERDFLIETLWPGQSIESGRNNLSLALSSLRRVFQDPVALENDAAAGSVLQADRQNVRLRAEGIETDVRQFEALLSRLPAVAAEAAASPDTKSSASRVLSLLSAATALYRGELLAGYDEEWLLGERERLRERFLFTLRDLVRWRAAAGDTAGALDSAHRALAADPLREEFHRALMALHIHSGEPTRAMNQFYKLRRSLQKAGEDAPSPETEALLREARKAVSAAGVSGGTTLVEALTLAAKEPTSLLLPSLPLSQPPTLPPAFTTEQEPARETPPAPPPPPLPLRLTPFLGREQDKATVLHWLRRADSPARVVTITGPGGVGKTRFALEVAGALQADNPPRGVWFIPLAEASDRESVESALETALGLMAGGGSVQRDSASPDAGSLPASGNSRPENRSTGTINNINSDGDTRRRERIVERLRRWQNPVLLLDNVEQLIADSAASDVPPPQPVFISFVLGLLERVPGLSLLLTSRQPLRIGGERVLPLPPLPVPPRDTVATAATAASAPRQPSFSAAELLRYPGVALFVDRAQAARPDFALTAGNAATLVTLCRRLEGVPLALEIAAAWASLMTPAQMLQRLESILNTDENDASRSASSSSLKQFASRRRDLPERHRSLHAVFAGSYDLLSPDLRQFLLRLSIFQGPFTVEAAHEICAPGGEPAETLLRLEELRERSLVFTAAPSSEANGSSDGNSGNDDDPGPRFALLQTLRSFARERWRKTEPDPARHDALARRHAVYYLRLVETVFPLLRSWDTPPALRRLDREQDNLRAVLHWSARATASPEDTLRGLTLCCLLRDYWSLRSREEEGLRFLEALLGPNADDDGPATDNSTYETRCDALLLAADFAGRCGCPEDALRWSQRSLRLSGPRGDRGRIGAATVTYGYQQGGRDPARWRAIREKALHLCRESGNLPWLGVGLYGLGRHLCSSGFDTQRGFRLLAEALEIARRAGDRPTECRLLTEIGALHTSCARCAPARLALEEAQTGHERLEDTGGIAAALRARGMLAFFQGEASDAARLLNQSLDLLRAQEIVSGVSETLYALADVYADGRGDHQKAWELADEAHALLLRGARRSLPDRIDSHLRRGHLLFRARRRGMAQSEAACAAALLADYEHRGARARLNLLQARLSAAAGEKTEPLALLAHVAGEAAAMERPLLLLAALDDALPLLPPGAEVVWSRGAAAGLRCTLGVVSPDPTITGRARDAELPETFRDGYAAGQAAATAFLAGIETSPSTSLVPSPLIVLSDRLRTKSGGAR